MNEGQIWESDYHVWVMPIRNSIVRLGLTQSMKEHLGKILYVDLPSIGSFCREGEVFVVLESSKSAIEILSPVSGTILEINDKLLADINLLNRSPEGEGWFVVMELSNSSE